MEPPPFKFDVPTSGFNFSSQPKTTTKNGKPFVAIDSNAEILRLQAALDTAQDSNRELTSQIIVFSNLQNSNTTLHDQVQDYLKLVPEMEEKIRNRDAEIAGLKAKSKTAEGEVDRANTAYAELTEELKGVEKKVADTEALLAIANSTIAARDATITAQEAQIGRDEAAAIVKEAEYHDLEKKYNTALANVEAEKVKLIGKQAELDIKQADNVGISEQLTTKTSKYDDLLIERNELKALEETRAQTEADLQIARDKITALNHQLEAFQADVQRRPFDLGPAAYTAAQEDSADTGDVPSTPSLAEDLARGRSFTSSVAASDDGYGSEFPQIDVEDETLKVEKEVAETEETSKVEIRTITETVTRIIYVPFEISAHNPLVCWLQTELNYLILFSIWVQKLLHVLTRWVPKIFGSSRHRFASPPLGDFDVAPRPSPLRPIGRILPEIAPTILEIQRMEAEKDRVTAEVLRNLPPLPESPDTGEVIGDPIPPLSPSSSGRAHILALDKNTADPPTAGMTLPTPSTSVVDTDAYARTAGPSENVQTAAGLLESQVRPWYIKIRHPRKTDLQSTRKSLQGLIFHLIVYYCLVMCYFCYYERSIWIAANDHTRAFVQQLLVHPHSNKSILQWVASGLPEHWKHNMDVFVFKYFVEQVGLHGNYAMPG